MGAFHCSTHTYATGISVVDIIILLVPITDTGISTDTSISILRKKEINAGRRKKEQMLA